MLVSTLALATCGFALPPPRAHVLPRRLGAAPWPAAAVPRAAVACSTPPGDARPPTREGAGGASVVLEGQAITGGSSVLVADEHGSWWTAVVVDVRSAGGDVDILVHYRGCDPDWDEWLAADSGRVSPQPPPPAGMTAGDETWRDVGDGLDPVTDAELLTRLRAERQATVDQWQYNTLCAAHGGDWAGVRTRYKSAGQDGGAGLRMEAGEGSAVSASVRMVGDLASSRTVTFSERGAAGLARPALTLKPADLRASRGHMAVGGAYTLAHSRTDAAREGAVAETEPLIIEIALAHAPPGAAGTQAEAAPKQRVRCTLAYSPFAEGGPAGGSEGARPRARRIEWVEVAREVSPAAALAGELPAWASALRGEAGNGLYDQEAQRGAAGLYSLYCPGGLTIVVPTELRAGTAAALSVDWDAGGMRYQADRKSGGAHDGALLTLELTEAMGSDDAAGAA